MRPRVWLVTPKIGRSREAHLLGLGKGMVTIEKTPALSTQCGEPYVSPDLSTQTGSRVYALLGPVNPLPVCSNQAL